MKRIQAYIDASTAEALSHLAIENNVSISHAAGNIIKDYLKNGGAKKNSTANQAHILRILNTINQVLMCVYDKGKTNIPGDTAEECIAQIREKVLEHVNAV